MILRYIIFLVAFFVSTNAYSQDSISNRTYKRKQYSIIEKRDYLVLYKKSESECMFFSTSLNSPIKRLTYHQIIFDKCSTYKVRENCRELRRRKIRLSEKYKDGEYFAFKVFNSFIQ